MRSIRSWQVPARLGLAAAFVLGSGLTAQAILNSTTDLNEVAESSAPAAVHAPDTTVFDDAFEAGDGLFQTNFNALDGVGANVGDGKRFTRAPRADLNGTLQWNKHTPGRVTGPNSDACNGCHEQALRGDDVKLFSGDDARFSHADGTPITDVSGDDGSGRSENDAVRDPTLSTLLNKFIERNTPHLFGMGGVQRAAEEITADLMADQNGAITTACTSAVGTTVTRNLTSENRIRKLDNNLENLTFGTISATRVSSGGNLCPNNANRYTLNTASVTGVSADLVVRPFQWKGVVAFGRDFARGASHNELGMQSVEITGDNVDGDGDGVANELTIPDQTAFGVYLGGQPRPVSVLDLDNAGFISPALSQGQKDAINNGNTVFNNIGCTNCHKFALLVGDPTFSEPSLSQFHRDNGTFPAGQPVLTPGKIQFDITKDIPDNQIFQKILGIPFKVADLGNFEKQNNIFLPGFGKTLVKLRGDVRRHNMGTNLAEPITDGSPTGGTTIAAGTWLTEALWGAGSTAPYLHDGRATTFAEAVLEHTCTLNATLPGRPGVICTDVGEASASVASFRALNATDRANLEAALQSQVLFKVESGG